MRRNKIKFKYLNLLNQLTISPEISDEVFIGNLEKINRFGTIYIGINGSLENNNLEIVCSGTIIIEPKIIRSGRNVGHIEDIVIDINYRGKGISQLLLNYLKDYSIKNNCYKIILDCNSDVCKVYEKNGFKKNGDQMVIYVNN